MVREGLTLSTDCLLSILKPVHVLITQAHTCRSFSNQKCTQVLGSVNYRSSHHLPRKVSPSSARPSFTTTHLPAPRTIPLSSLTIPLLSPLAQLVMSQIPSFHSWKLFSQLLFFSCPLTTVTAMSTTATKSCTSRRLQFQACHLLSWSNETRGFRVSTFTN